MQDAQLLLLPQRLRKKQSQRTSQDPLQSFSACLSARGQPQNVWRPAGCHSVHTTGVEGVNLQHPFSRPSSPGQSRKSCSNEASQTWDKENEATTTRSSRIFKQTKGLDVHTKGTHHSRLPSQHPGHVNIHQGILHLPDPLSAPGSRASRSPSPCRPALSSISNNCLNRAGSNSMLQPTQQQNKSTPHTAVYSPRRQSQQRIPHSQSSSCRESICNRRVSCGSSSSCSGYTPGARGTHHVEYISPLHEGLRLHGQQQRQPQLSPSSHHSASPYLHALVREMEQPHGQAFTNSRNISPLGYTGSVSEQQLHTPVASTARNNLKTHTGSQQHPQCCASTERAASPAQLPDDAMETYYSPVLPNLHQQFEQQYRLTPCYTDLDEYDTVQQESCSSAGRQMQESVPPPWAESRPTFHLSSSQLPHRVSELLKPAATASPRPVSPRQDMPLHGTAHFARPELYQQQSDLALGLQQQCGGQQLLGQEKSMCDAISASPCDQDADRSAYRREHECQRQEQMNTSGLLKVDPNKMALDVVPPDARHGQQQHQQLAHETPSYPTPQEDLELQQRRQQWRAHQQLQQQQCWLSQLEIQQHQHRSSTPAADGHSRYERQQHPQKPQGVASPAAAAAASAIADYSRIIEQAQAMAQKSEAAWAQLNKYHQHRVCGRLPGSSSAGRSRTPTSVAGNRQVSRMGRPGANAAASGNTAAAAAPVAVSPTSCKTLGSSLLQLSSPAVYYTPTGSLSSGSIRRLPARPPAFLCNPAGPPATAAAGAKYRELPSLPGSPAAAAKQDGNSNGSCTGGGRAPTMARQLNFGPAGATVQSLRDSSDALKAAARASIAASLRSSCDETPVVELLVLPDCSTFATQPTGIRGRDQCVSSNNSVLMPGAGGRRGSMSQACSPLPSSPAWSVYLTPGAADPTSIGAAAAAITAAGGDTIIARCAGLGSGDCVGAWWRTPEDQKSLQQIQLQQQAIGSLQYDGAKATPVVGATPLTGVRPRDLLDCFDDVEQLLAAQVGPGGAVYGARSAVAAAVTGDADMQGSSDALCSSRCSTVEGFPFTPGSTGSITFYGANNSIKKQHLGQLASHTAHNDNASLAFISPAAAASRASEPAVQPAATGQPQGSGGADCGATWLDKYLDAKSAAAVTPDSSAGSVRSASMTCQRQCAGPDMMSSPLDIWGMEASAFAADDDGLLGHNGATYDQKEAWTVHNNWVATGMDAVAESVDVAAAAISLFSITDAVNVPSRSTACPSSSDHDAVPISASSEQAPLQSSSCNHLQRQELCSKLSSGQPTSSNIVSTVFASVTATSSNQDTDNPDNLGPLLDNLTPAQALAAYTQLAHKLKQRMDETTGGLLARLNLSTPAPSCSTSTRCSADGMVKDELQFDAAPGSTSVRAEFQASVPAAVVCKQAVGMVVLSPHTACGRWQSSRAVAE